MPAGADHPGAGVAACRAVAAVLGARVQIKWVNDLLLGERKVAGILAIAVPDPLRVVLGVGLNLRPRPDIPLAATALPIGWLQASGAPDRRTALATALLGELAALLARPATIMPAYRQLAAWVGEPVVLTGAGPVHRGTVAGFADSGALLLDTPAGRISAATGSIRRATP
ncbi:biotin--[acetyl-CoA-carboxylase] ligase [Lacticaseibacillus kribbianus]|uniref:biotin--[acetyl-CoA-carboxylase] ligase n=1 Tax=Lacticaseibacillus kribbianus TaxID=2926292 RepID=UPI001CD80FC9